MARCPNCGHEVPDDARFCPSCGVAQPYRKQAAQSEQQPPLPFSPWAPPRMEPQPAGAGSSAGASAARRAEPAVGPPLSMRQVGIAVGAILLFLALIILVGRSGFHGGGNAGRQETQTLPTLGVMGEALEVGNTTWGAAFTDQVERVDNQAPQRGQFLAVGIVIGNKSGEVIPLSTSSVGLLDEKSGERFTPRMTAWGTPDEITAGHYSTTFSLPAHRAIAGLIVFDVPTDISKPCLLVRDLTKSATEYTGVIDLTQKKSE